MTQHSDDPRTRQFWNDLVALNNRSKEKERVVLETASSWRGMDDVSAAATEIDGARSEAREFLTSHSYLWPQIKADMAAYPDDEKWMSWNIALAICEAIDSQHT